jgi:hypothetical protein
MKAVFADTSFYVALASPRDVAHARAVQVGERLHRPVLLTERLPKHAVPVVGRTKRACYPRTLRGT